MIDGLGMGIGFTLALLIISSVREVLGGGSFFNLKINFLQGKEILIFVLAPGAFIVYGYIIAIVRAFQKK